jgi:hypothetical protein
MKNKYYAWLVALTVTYFMMRAMAAVHLHPFIAGWLCCMIFMASKLGYRQVVKNINLYRIFMKRDYKFRIGQKVTKKDEFGNTVRGEVVDECLPYSIFIQWTDLLRPVEYQPHEFDSICLDYSK